MKKLPQGDRSYANMFDPFSVIMLVEASDSDSTQR